MSNRLRRIFAVTCAALLMTTAAQGQALSQGDAANAPAVVDLLVLRPAGFVGLVIGSVVFTAISPLVLITRPQEIGTPFEALVARPARYLWVDPIGGH